MGFFGLDRSLKGASEPADFMLMSETIDFILSIESRFSWARLMLGTMKVYCRCAASSDDVCKRSLLATSGSCRVIFGMTASCCYCIAISLRTDTD